MIPTKGTEDNKLPPHKVKIGAAPAHRLEATEVINEGEIMLSGSNLGFSDPISAGSSRRWVAPARAMFIRRTAKVL